MNERLENPWLVAAWPGMGAVARLAGAYLAEQLDAEPIAEIPAEAWFEPQGIRVKGGLVQGEELPRSRLLGCKDPLGRRDLVIFLAEAQPAVERYGIAEDVLNRAQELGVTRVCTFAAMATTLDARAPSRVVSVATNESVLAELREHEIALLPEGEIGGLNGLLLAAAARRGLEGVCLLGEFPYFASSLPNPKASAAVLRAFGSLSGVEVNTEALERGAREMESALVELQSRLQASGALPEGFETRMLEEPERETTTGLDAEIEAEIERLFERAGQDRSQALKLKEELDRHEIFRLYEDRFLDLFKKAE